MTINDITQAIIGGAIEVHRGLGPGLLESAHLECLCRELTLRNISFVRELPFANRVQGHPTRMWVLLLSYLRLGGWKVGLLINFQFQCSGAKGGRSRASLGLGRVAGI